LKVIHLSQSDTTGGAARAAYRIHYGLRYSGIDSSMWVNKASAGDWTVQGPSSKFNKVSAAVRPHLLSPLVKTLKTANPILHSPAVLPSQWVKRINASDAVIVHLHWVQNEMLSIADIGRIERPIIWTLHDMWAFCGAEHLSNDNRWHDGYRHDNRPPHESGFDLNRWAWNRKRKHWQQPIQIVTPSSWLADCVRESALMRDWPVTVIPNPIDTDRWCPLPQALARTLLGLPADVPLLLFGAVGGTAAYHKGFDLLQAALKFMRDAPVDKGIELVVFGQRAPKYQPDIGFPIHYTGHLHDDLSLRALYSAANVMVVPSRQEAFGQTASEAHACGTPVVAFDTCGLPDIVSHQQTGYLAKAFDAEDLAKGINWVLQHPEPESLSQASRDKVLRDFEQGHVAVQYIDLYKRVLASL